jgi:hypothetical protein
MMTGVARSSMHPHPINDLPPVYAGHADIEQHDAGAEPCL